MILLNRQQVRILSVSNSKKGDEMKTHTLKIEPEYLENLISGRKKFEIRYNDRDYQLGDILEFSDWKGKYSFEITHTHSGYGLQDGFVILSVVAK